MSTPAPHRFHSVRVAGATTASVSMVAVLAGLATGDCSEGDSVPTAIVGDSGSECDASSSFDAEADAVGDAVHDAVETAPEAGPECAHPEVQSDCSAGWCRIPKGCFVIGSPLSEWARGKYSEDQVQVTLTHDFMIQQKETTQAEWTASGFPNPSQPNTEPNQCGSCMDPDCPVGNLTWFDALAFSNKLSELATPPLQPCYALTGCSGEAGNGLVCESASVVGDLYECPGYRLPTEAEWEYAARAGTGTAFYTGSIVPLSNLGTCAPDPNLERIAWYCLTTGADRRTHPGGQKESNPWGLFDTAGNVAEWVNDHFTGSGYGTVPLVDPGKALVVGTWTSGVRRGGFATIWSSFCRVANRMETPRYARGSCSGLRMVRTTM